MRAYRRSAPWLKRLTLIGLGLLLTGLFSLGGLLPMQPTPAQTVELTRVTEQIYQQLPDLPLENDYLNDQTGRVSSDNTLLGRLIRYHIYAKGRPPNYRLDWKLTLADYLGVNERIEPKTYPSGSSLRQNPMTADIAAIQRLTLAQRTALVDLLAASFTAQASPEAAPSPAPSPASPAPNPAPDLAPPSRFPRQPQPGDAQLLQP